MREVSDLATDRARGIKEESDEQPTVLKRVRRFQERLAENENIDKSKYDRFGVVL